MGETCPRTGLPYVGLAKLKQFDDKALFMRVVQKVSSKNVLQERVLVLTWDKMVLYEIKSPPKVKREVLVADVSLVGFVEDAGGVRRTLVKCSQDSNSPDLMFVQSNDARNDSNGQADFVTILQAVADKQHLALEVSQVATEGELQEMSVLKRPAEEGSPLKRAFSSFRSNSSQSPSRNSTRKSLPPLSPTSDASARAARGKSAPPGGKLSDTAFGPNVDSPNGSFNSSHYSAAHRSMSVMNEAALPPLARVPPSLKSFNKGDIRIFFIRIVEKRSAKGRWQKRVVILTQNSFVLAETDRQIKRHVRFEKIQHLTYQSVQDDKHAGSVNQYLMKVPGEQDLLWSQTHDSRNDRSVTQERFLECLQQIMSARSLKLNAEKVAGEDMEEAAQLKKSENYQKPVVAIREMREQLKRQDSWNGSANGSPLSQRSSSWFGGGSRRESVAPSEDERLRSKSHSPHGPGSAASSPQKRTPQTPLSPLKTDNIMDVLRHVTSQREWEDVQESFQRARCYALCQGMREHLPPADLQRCVDVLAAKGVAFERSALTQTLDSIPGSLHSMANLTPYQTSPVLQPADIPLPEQPLVDSVLAEANAAFSPHQCNDTTRSALQTWSKKDVDVPPLYVGPITKHPSDTDAERILVVSMENVFVCDTTHRLKHCVPLDRISGITYSSEASPMYLISSKGLRIELGFKLGEPSFDLAGLLKRIVAQRRLGIEVNLVSSTDAVLQARTIPTLNEATLKENAKTSPIMTPTELVPAGGKLNLATLCAVIPPAVVTPAMKDLLEEWFGAGTPALHTQVVDRVDEKGEIARRVLCLVPEYATICDFQRNFKQAVPLTAITEMQVSSDTEPLITLLAPSLNTKIRFISADHARNKTTSAELVMLIRKLFITRGLPLECSLPAQPEDANAKTVLVTPARSLEDGPVSPLLSPGELPASIPPTPEQITKIQQQFPPIQVTSSMKLVMATWFGPDVQILKLLYVERLGENNARATRVLAMTWEYLLMCDVDRNIKHIMPLSAVTSITATKFTEENQELTYLITSADLQEEFYFVAVHDTNNGDIAPDFIATMLRALLQIRGLPCNFLEVNSVAEMRLAPPIQGRRPSLAPATLEPQVCSVSGIPTVQCPEALENFAMSSKDLLYVRAVLSDGECPRAVLSITHDKICLANEATRDTTVVATRDLVSLRIRKGQGRRHTLMQMTVESKESISILLSDDPRNAPMAALPDLIQELVAFHGIQGFEVVNDEEEQEVVAEKKRPTLALPGSETTAVPVQGVANAYPTVTVQDEVTVSPAASSPVASPPVSPSAALEQRASLPPPGVSECEIPPEFAYLAPPHKEPVLFVRAVEKVSSHGQRQKRILMLTPNRVILWDEKSAEIKRYIDLKLITDMIVLKTTERRGILSSKEDLVYHILLRVPGEQLDLLFVQCHDVRNASHGQDEFGNILRLAVSALGSQMDEELVTGTNLSDLAQLVKTDTYKAPAVLNSGTRSRGHSEVDESIKITEKTEKFGYEKARADTDEVTSLKQQLLAHKEELQKVRTELEMQRLGNTADNTLPDKRDEQIKTLLYDLHAERQKSAELQRLIDHLHREAQEAAGAGNYPVDALEMERMRAKLLLLEKQKGELEVQLSAQGPVSPSPASPVAPVAADFAALLQDAGMTDEERAIFTSLRITHTTHLQDVTGIELRARFPPQLVRRVLRLAGYKEVREGDCFVPDVPSMSPASPSSPTVSRPSDGKLAQKLRVAHDVNKAQRETITILREQIKVLKTLHSSPGRMGSPFGGLSASAFSAPRSDASPNTTAPVAPPAVDTPGLVSVGGAEGQASPAVASQERSAQLTPPHSVPATPEAAPMPETQLFQAEADTSDAPPHTVQAPPTAELLSSPSTDGAVPSPAATPPGQEASPPTEAEPEAVAPSVREATETAETAEEEEEAPEEELHNEATEAEEADTDASTAALSASAAARPPMPPLPLQQREGSLAPEHPTDTPILPEMNSSGFYGDSVDTDSVKEEEFVEKVESQVVEEEVVEVKEEEEKEEEAAVAAHDAAMLRTEEVVSNDADILSSSTEGDIGAEVGSANVIREHSLAPEQRDGPEAQNELPTPASSVYQDENISSPDTPEPVPETMAAPVQSYDDTSSDIFGGSEADMAMASDIPFVGSPPAGMGSIKPNALVESSDDES